MTVLTAHFKINVPCPCGECFQHRICRSHASMHSAAWKSLCQDVVHSLRVVSTLEFKHRVPDHGFLEGVSLQCPESVNWEDSGFCSIWMSRSGMVPSSASSIVNWMVLTVEMIQKTLQLPSAGNAFGLSVIHVPPPEQLSAAKRSQCPLLKLFHEHLWKYWAKQWAHWDSVVHLVVDAACSSSCSIASLLRFVLSGWVLLSNGNRISATATASVAGSSVNIDFTSKDIRVSLSPTDSSLSSADYDSELSTYDDVTGVLGWELWFDVTSWSCSEELAPPLDGHYTASIPSWGELASKLLQDSCSQCMSLTVMSFSANSRVRSMCWIPLILAYHLVMQTSLASTNSQFSGQSWRSSWHEETAPSASLSHFLTTSPCPCWGQGK